MQSTATVTSTSIDITGLEYSLSSSKSIFYAMPFSGIEIVRDGTTVYIPFSSTDTQLLNNPYSGGTQQLFLKTFQDALAKENLVLGSSLNITQSSNTATVYTPNNKSLYANEFNISELNHSISFQYFTYDNSLDPTVYSNFYFAAYQGNTFQSNISIIPTFTSVVAGQDAKFQIQTTNLPIGYTLSYSISGVDTSYVTNLTGTLTSSSPYAVLDIPTLVHAVNHGNKTMTVSINGAVSASINLIDNSPPFVPDNYDGVRLTINNVYVGNTLYKNVVCTVKDVLSVSGGTPSHEYDTYSPSNNQLQIAAVNYGASTYDNVIVTVGVVISYQT